MSRWLPLLAILATTAVLAQQPAPLPPPLETPGRGAPAAVEKLGPNSYRMGTLKIDTAKREVVVPGTVNPVNVLEFVANTKGGAKAYESALTLDCNAFTFNAAMLLIGLDPARGRPAAMQFDRTPPKGDAVDIAVEWVQDGEQRRVPIERLLFDQRSNKTIPEGPWVYAGSTFVDFGDGTGKYFMAELDGVLIGFMHGPQAIIDNPRNDALDGFGAIVFNTSLGLEPETSVTLKVTAVPTRGQR